jgi:uncharacterized membrane protein
MGGSPEAQASGVAGPPAERRWPMALAVSSAIVLQVIVPSRGRLTGWWTFVVVEFVMLVILIVTDPGRIDRRNPSLRYLTIALIALMTVANMVAALLLLRDILKAFAFVTATLLLGRGAAIWVTNVIVFSLWYWELDRGGPAERAGGTGIAPSFLFPEETAPEPPALWIPTFPDYLYLSFTNATAFSPTDTLPIRTWAKMTMMVESVVSLLTGILVIARAVNILR